MLHHSNIKNSNLTVNIFVDELIELSTDRRQFAVRRQSLAARQSQLDPAGGESIIEQRQYPADGGIRRHLGCGRSQRMHRSAPRKPVHAVNGAYPPPGGCYSCVICS
jgi:hypothetical protein